MTVAAAPKPSRLRKIWTGLVQAVTSPTAIKQERSLASFVIGRVLLAAGASFGVEQIVVKMIAGA